MRGAWAVVLIRTARDLAQSSGFGGAHRFRQCLLYLPPPGQDKALVGAADEDCDAELKQDRNLVRAADEDPHRPTTPAAGLGDGGDGGFHFWIAGAVCAQRYGKIGGTDEEAVHLIY